MKKLNVVGTSLAALVLSCSSGLAQFVTQSVPTVWRASEGQNASDGNWYIWSDKTRSSFGGGADVPVPSSYERSGEDNIATWRPSTGVWSILNLARTQFSNTQWGTGGDIPVPGDYDGDGKTDLAVWRPSNGTWYILYSRDNYSYASAKAWQWGIAIDIPVPGDYDSDGKTD